MENKSEIVQMILLLQHKKKYMQLKKECEQMEHEFTFKKERIQEIMLKTPQNSSDSEQNSKKSVESENENTLATDHQQTTQELKK